MSKGLKRGPKPIEINWEEFEKLCAMQCTIQEIAAWFNCCHDTVESKVYEHYGEKFSVIFAQKRKVGLISLRRAQWQQVLKGNTALLIWMGKQHLDQSEKVDQKQTIVTDHKFKIGFADEDDRAESPAPDATSKTDPAIN